MSDKIFPWQRCLNFQYLKAPNGKFLLRCIFTIWWQFLEIHVHNLSDLNGLFSHCTCNSKCPFVAECGEHSIYCRIQRPPVFWLGLLQRDAEIIPMTAGNNDLQFKMIKRIYILTRFEEAWLSQPTQIVNSPHMLRPMDNVKVMNIFCKP